MNIGLDFDGVITDCGELKSRGAKEIYGVDILPEKMKKEIVIDSGILTSEQYRNIQNQVYGTRELGLFMEPVDGVLEYLPKLLEESNDIRIITSRGKLESKIAQEWLEKNGIFLHITSVGYGNHKIEACKGLDIYADDDLDKLEPLVEVVPHRFLFTWGYNENIEVNPSIAMRVSSWKQFYRAIKNNKNQETKFNLTQ